MICDGQNLKSWCVFIYPKLEEFRCVYVFKFQHVMCVWILTCVQLFSSSRVDVCLYHYGQVPVVPHKNTVSKTGRLQLGQRKKQLPCRIDEVCTSLVGTRMPPHKMRSRGPSSSVTTLGTVRPSTSSSGSWVERFRVNFLQVGQGVRLGHKRNQCVWRTSDSTMTTKMTVQDPTRRWVKWGGRVE
jgi:hypothetical protein